MVGLIRITVVRAEIKLFGLTLVYLGTIFKHKCLFNFILSHDVREGHIVNSELKILAIFIDSQGVLPELEGVGEGAVKYLFLDYLRAILEHSSASA